MSTDNERTRTMETDSTQNVADMPPDVVGNLLAKAVASRKHVPDEKLLAVVVGNLDRDSEIQSGSGGGGETTTRQAPAGR